VSKPIKLNLENYSDNFFEVNHKNGFLPKDSPLAVLPKKYTELQVLIDEMPIKKDDGTDGFAVKKRWYRGCGKQSFKFKTPCK
jgi:hypothetical protein